MSYKDAILALEKGPVSPVYLLYGEELYHQKKWLEKLKECLAGPEEQPVFVEKADGRKMGMNSLLDWANQISLMAVRRLLILEDSSLIPCRKSNEKKGAEEEQDQVKATEAAGPSEEDFKRWQAYLSQPSHDTCLVLWMRQGVPHKGTKLVKSIDKVRGLVALEQVKPGEMPLEIKAMAQAKGITLTPDAMKHMVTYGMADLTALDAELEKLAAYKGSAPQVDKAMVEKIMTPSLEADVFKMVDALAEGKAEVAIKECRRLLARKEYWGKVWAMMVRQFRMLSKEKTLEEAGLSRKERQDTMKLHPFVFDKVIRQNQAYSQTRLLRILALMEVREMEMKNGMAPARGMEDFILEVAAQSRSL